jgi:hypothetical protein
MTDFGVLSSLSRRALAFIRSIGPLAILSTIFILIIAALLAFNNPLRITAIDVINSPLTAYPFKGEILAYAIGDRVNAIFERAKIDQRVVHIEIGQPQEVTVDIPGEKFSVSEAANFLRSMLRIDPHEVSGTLIQLPTDKAASSDLTPEVVSHARYRLILTKSDRPGILCDSEGQIEDLIDGAATSIIDETEPIIAANYTRTLGSSKRIDAVNKAQRAVVINLGDKATSGQLLSNPLRQAYLVLGYTLGDDQQFPESDKMFLVAAAGGDPSQSARSWDGMAYVRIRAANDENDSERRNSLLDDAMAKLKEAEKALPEYDSALFHEAEIAEIRARNSVTNSVAKPERTSIKRQKTSRL